MVSDERQELVLPGPALREHFAAVIAQVPLQCGRDVGSAASVPQNQPQFVSQNLSMAISFLLLQI